MATLKSRDKQIPNGFKYLQPETGWQAPQWQSFDTLVKSVMRHRQGNMYLARKHNWALEYNSVAFEMDAYNAKLCEAHGWNEFITEAIPEPPKWMPPQLDHEGAAELAGAGKKTAAAVSVVVDWLGSGLRPVPIELAEKRGFTCLLCPNHVKEEDRTLFQRIGDVAAGRLKKLVEIKNALKLKTKNDGGLGSCGVCDCAMRLKIWVPLEHVQDSTDEATKAKLWEKCWITNEVKQ